MVRAGGERSLCCDFPRGKEKERGGERNWAIWKIESGIEIIHEPRSLISRHMSWIFRSRISGAEGSKRPIW